VGLDIKRFHALRGAFTTLMDKAGVSERVTMEQAGHKTPSVTRAYQDPMFSQQKDAAQAYDGQLLALLELAATLDPSTLRRTI